MDDFRFLMIGAMYENGGNTTHRFLDGHPQLFVYPFESQVGTRHVQDALTSMFPQKYRWPAFLLDATPAEDYHAIIDEEYKVRTRTPKVSKFRDWPMEANDDERKRRYVEIIGKTGRSRGKNMAAFFRATFDTWKDYRRSGREVMHVGYSPIIGVDGGAILDDLPQAHVLHVVRNPWSAYADTKKRPVPLGLRHYMLGWTLNQYHALLYRDRYPGRFHVLRTEDVMQDPHGTLGALCDKLGLERADSLRTPSWNGKALDEVYPWGTIRIPTPEQNKKDALSLSPQERDEIRAYTSQYLETFDFKGIV